MAMLEITPQVQLDEGEVQLSFIRSSGPGGQNVNKVATGVQLRLDVANSPSLPEDLRRRLGLLAGSRMTPGGVLIIDAHRHRSQEKNRQDAFARLVELLRLAAKEPRRRRKTTPTRASQLRRIEKKRRRSETKARRRAPRFED